MKSQHSFNYRLILIVFVLALVIGLTVFFTTSIEKGISNQKQGSQNINATTEQESQGAVSNYVFKKLPLILTIKDDDNLKPISKAIVKIESDAISQSFLTNSKGQITLKVLESNDKEYSISIEKTGYVSYSFHSILKPGEQEITLLKNIVEENYSENETQSLVGDVIVSAFIDDQPASIDNTSKVILRGADDSKLTEGIPDESGSVVFSNVKDQLGYAELLANGVYSKTELFSLANQNVEVRGYTFAYSESKGLNYYDNLNQTGIILNTTENVTAQVQVYSGNKLVYEGTLKPLIPSFVSLDDSTNSTVTVLVSGLVLVSQLQIGKINYVDYNSNDNSYSKYHLTVTPILSDGSRSDAFISIIKDQSKILEVSTINQSLDLTLEEGEYLVKGSTSDSRGEEKINLDSDKLLELKLFSGNFIVTVRTLDENQSNLPSHVYFTQKENQTCFAFNSLCQFPAVNGKALITASAEGFVDSTIIQEINKDESLNITLIHTTELSSNNKVFFKGFYENGVEATKLFYGKEYDASFTIVSKSPSLFYLRTSSNDEDLLIQRKSLVENDVYFVSSDFKNDPSCSESNDFTEINGGFKWIVLNIPAGITTKNIKVKVSDNLIGKKSLLINYKASPIQKFTCHDNLYSKGIIAYGHGVSLSNGTEDVFQAELLNQLNTPQHPEEEDSLYFGIDKNGNPTVNKPITNFYLDNIYPADSIRLVNSNQLTFRIEGPNKDCFDFPSYNDIHYLVLKADFLNPSCNIKNFEGKLPEAGEDNKLVALNTLAPSKQITILFNIKVDNLKFHVSNEYIPAQRFSKMVLVGSDSMIPLKLSLNFGNKVSYSSVQSAATSNGFDYSFTEPDVKVLMWNDKPSSSLDLMIGSTNLASWNFDKLSSNTFETESLAFPSPKMCTGETCCTGYFCDSTQTQMSTKAFEKNSAELFRKTYFKRSSKTGMPFNLIQAEGRKPSRSTVISTTQNNNIKQLGFPKGSYAPATQKITVRPISKEIIDLEYDSEILTLNPSDYLNNQCQRSTTLQGFQHATSGCVYSSRDPTLPTIIQGPSPQDNVQFSQEETNSSSQDQTSGSSTDSNSPLDQPRFFNVTYKHLVFAQPILGATVGSFVPGLKKAITPQSTAAICDGLGVGALVTAGIGDIIYPIFPPESHPVGEALGKVGEVLAGPSAPSVGPAGPGGVCNTIGKVQAYIPFWETTIYEGNDSDGNGIYKQLLPPIQNIADGLPRWTYARCVGKTYGQVSSSNQISFCVQVCRKKTPTVNIYVDGDNFIVRAVHGLEVDCTRLDPNLASIFDLQSGAGICDYGCVRKKSESGLWNKISSKPGVSISLQNFCSAGLDYISQIMYGNSIYSMTPDEANNLLSQAIVKEANRIVDFITGKVSDVADSGSGDSTLEKVINTVIKGVISAFVSQESNNVLSQVRMTAADYSDSWIKFGQSFLCTRGGGVDAKFASVLLDSISENPELFSSASQQIFKNKDIANTLRDSLIKSGEQAGLQLAIDNLFNGATSSNYSSIDTSNYTLKTGDVKTCSALNNPPFVGVYGVSYNDFLNYTKRLNNYYQIKLKELEDIVNDEGTIKKVCGCTCGSKRCDLENLGNWVGNLNSFISDKFIDPSKSYLLKASFNNLDLSNLYVKFYASDNSMPISINSLDSDPFVDAMMSYNSTTDSEPRRPWNTEFFFVNRRC